MDKNEGVHDQAVEQLFELSGVAGPRSLHFRLTVREHMTQRTTSTRVLKRSRGSETPHMSRHFTIYNEIYIDVAKQVL